MRRGCGGLMAVVALTRVGTCCVVIPPLQGVVAIPCVGTCRPAIPNLHGALAIPLGRFCAVVPVIAALRRLRR